MTIQAAGVPVDPAAPGEQREALVAAKVARVAPVERPAAPVAPAVRPTLAVKAVLLAETQRRQSCAERRRARPSPRCSARLLRVVRWTFRMRAAGSLRSPAAHVSQRRPA